MDFRPSSQVPAQQGALYGIGNRSNIYTINPRNGRATLAKFIKDANGARIAPRGSSFGIDFNPTADRLPRRQRGRSEPPGQRGYRSDHGRWRPRLRRRRREGGPKPLGNGDGLHEQSTGGVQQPQRHPPRYRPDDHALRCRSRSGHSDNPEPAQRRTLNTGGGLGFNARLNSGFDAVTAGGVDQAYAALQIKNRKAAGFFRVDLETSQTTSLSRINGGRTRAEGLAIPSAAKRSAERRAERPAEGRGDHQSDGPKSG